MLRKQRDLFYATITMMALVLGALLPARAWAFCCGLHVLNPDQPQYQTTAEYPYRFTQSTSFWSVVAAMPFDPGDDADLELQLEATIDGSDLTLDFTGSADAHDGNLNCPLSVTLSACYFAVLVLADPGGHQHLREAARQTILDHYALNVCLGQLVKFFEEQVDKYAAKQPQSPALANSSH